MLKYTLMLLGSRLVRVLPLWFAYRVAGCLARLAVIVIPARKRALTKNYAVITGKTDGAFLGRLVRSAYRHLALNTVDFLQFPTLSPDRIVRMGTGAGLENLDRALGRGRGVVLVTCHLGHWEFGGALLASLGYPVTVIAESIAPARKLFREERIASLFRDFREKTGMTVIPMEKAMMRAARALKGGKVLVFLADRDIAGSGVEVTFFGRQRSLPRGPAFFSLRLGSPIVPGYVVREEDGMHLGTVCEAIDTEGLSCDEAGIRELTQKIAERLERMIISYPDQWFVFEPFWEEQNRQDSDNRVPQGRH
jgi:KDO2-lipid IV(A) lauroyltransferase